MSKEVIIISGPTATGKTKLSFDIGKIFDNLNKKAEIVNFDSLLFYKELNIGTAKPTITERSIIQHHMIDIASISSPINAADFAQKAKTIIQDLLNNDIVPILVGGSGFYLRALIKGMYKTIEIPQDVKDDIEYIYKKHGIDSFWEELNKNDPESADKLHINDHYRILRAIEYMRTTGEKISKEKKRFEQNNPYDFTLNNEINWNLLHLYLDINKQDHQKIINNRTHDMINSGLIDEVHKLLQQGFSSKNKPLQSIGYKETINYLSNKSQNVGELIEKINIATRQLAKSQRTFFNKIIGKITLNPLDIKSTNLKNIISNFFINK